MSSHGHGNPPAGIWQGFHHAWEYNHRLNRFGSYVRTRFEDGAADLVAGHTAASGTGGDVAHVSEYLTPLSAAGVGFQEGWAETTVECPRAVTTAYRMRVEVLLAPDLVGKESYTVLLNGFDLCAERHADKLIAFDLEVTEPTLSADGASLRFNILGELCFDCRTAECQMWPLTLEMARADGSRSEPDGVEPPSPPAPRKRGIRKRPAFEQGVNWLKRQIARVTDLENVKQGIVGREENRLRRRLFRLFGRQFFLRLLKMRILTPYALSVPYLIVAGDAEDLRVTDAAPIENSYTWDAETEIHREQVGSRPVAVAGGHPDQYALNTFGFKRISLTTELDPAFGTSNPIQWGKGMHLLAWDAAVRDIRPDGGRVTGKLDLFYKSWSEAMNEVLTLTTWGAVRSAGRATLGARLALLQFREAAPGVQQAVPGRIHWPGGGLNAQDDPRARCERAADGGNGADCSA